jgi:cytochrome c553
MNQFIAFASRQGVGAAGMGSPNRKRDKNMMKTWLISVAVTAAFLSHGVQAAGDAKAGEAKTAVCMACHGPAGNSLVPTWPKLAGQHSEYIYKQLMDFKSGARVNESMSPQVLALNEQDFADLAAYYAAQTQTGGTTDPAALELGGRLFRGGNAETGVPACTGCHGPAGLGVGAAKYPRLAGQHATYVESTLKLYRDGTRANDPNAMMREVAHRLTDAEIAAVSQFVQGLSQ